MTRPPTFTALLAGCLALATAAVGHAEGAYEGPSALSRCVEEALGAEPRPAPQAAADGGSPARIREFLLAGDSRVHPLHFEQAGCRAFVAVGAKHTQDLELRVQDTEGRLLATSEGPTTTPFVFHCGQADDDAVVVLRMLDGQGEVVLSPLPSSQLDENAKAVLSRCKAVGTPRPPVADVGPEPKARAIGEELEQLTVRLAALGYRPSRPVGYGTLATQQHNASLMQVTQGRCYAVAAVGSRDVADLDLRVFEPSTSLSPMVEDVTRRRVALVKLCAETTGRFVLDVAAFQGQGGYMLQLFELLEPSERPRGLVGDSRISYAETVSRMRARGFVPAPMGSSVVVQNAQLTTPVPVEGGRCYAYAAVSGEQGRIGKLELSLLDGRGALLAQHAPNAQDPMVFDCPTDDSVRKLVLRTRDGRGSGRATLLVGSEATPEAAATSAVTP